MSAARKEFLSDLSFKGEDRMPLWTMRFKSRGVRIGVIEAADLTEAEAVGRAFCAEHSGEFMQFMQIDGPFVLADASILTRQPAPDAAEPVSERPNLVEQRERTKHGGSRDARADA